MFPVNLFKVDENTKRIVATAADLGTVRGPGAIFENMTSYTRKGNKISKVEEMGLFMDMGLGSPAAFTVKDQIDREDRLTQILEPTTTTTVRYPYLIGYKMVVISKLN
jgi:hypothetical protein